MEEVMLLIAVIISELSLIFIGITIIPVINETKYKKYINYIFPILVVVGFVELILYYLI